MCTPGSPDELHPTRPNNESENEQAKRTSSFKKFLTYMKGFISNLGDATTISNGALAVFTGLLVLVALLQWCTLKKTDETARLRDRAFVYFSNPIPVDLLVPYKGWDIRVIVQNSGNMPASKVVIRHTCVEANKSQWHADLWKLGEWAKEPGPNILGPKNTFLFVACFLNANAIESLKSTNTIQFVMTEITYFDGFDHKKVRITRANRIFNFDPSGGHSFRFADYHNCSDEDCQSTSHPGSKSSAKPN